MVSLTSPLMPWKSLELHLGLVNSSAEEMLYWEVGGTPAGNKNEGNINLRANG